MNNAAMGWEQRMSDRAHARRAEQQATDDAEQQRRWDRWLQREDVQGRQLAASMTLAEAAQLLRAPLYACACIGGALCCRFRFAQALALARAAHITIKMIADRVVAGAGFEPATVRDMNPLGLTTPPPRREPAGR